MKAKTYYIYAETLAALDHRSGEPFKVIKQSDVEKLVKRAAKVPYAYWGTGRSRPIPVGEDTVRLVFKSIGLL